MTDRDKTRFYLEVGKAIRVARQKEKLNQKELSHKVGMSRASIVNIEKGRQHPPLHQLWQFSNALKVSIYDLIPDFEIKEEDISLLFQKKIKLTGEKGQIQEDSVKKVSTFVSRS